MPQIYSIWSSTGICLWSYCVGLYSTSLSRVIIKHNINHHLYADDTQVYTNLYIIFTNGHTTSMSTVDGCLADILSWMESGKLKLNIETSGLIIIGTKQQRNKIVDYFPVKILGNDTSPSDTLWELWCCL